ncbi:transmembrane protein 68 isoform X2 [Colossoma macropomum]|uniref:transmembrane protein 68 isoform X2 n=1 Tax=Colossoma macropomum TaxID=42526 RepID=UPI001863D7C1|nr:transmembrane protein 68 isoform X2 [Colossoma macropomum]
MSNESESCWSGNGSVGVLTCLLLAWEDWAGLGNLEDYLSFLEYLLWVFTPLAIVFILPFLIVILIYLSILFLHVYKRKNQLREAYSNNLWDGARKTLATLWDGHGAIWHGIKPLLEVFSVIHGPQEECVKALRSGHLLGIAPGGVREALFSDETYPLVWGKRKGFAQVAIDSKVPIIPMFTQNVREGFRSLGTLRFFRWVYERFRLPIAPVYGGFPVKFRTYLGDPIPYDPKLTAAELAEKVQAAVQALIDRHQKIPGNILRALLERFHTRPKAE